MFSKHYLALILCLIEFTQLKSQDVVQNVKLDNKEVRCLGKSVLLFSIMLSQCTLFLPLSLDLLLVTGGNNLIFSLCGKHSGIE